MIAEGRVLLTAKYTDKSGIALGNFVTLENPPFRLVKPVRLFEKEYLKSQK
jgi:hypothetical protein